MPSTDKNVEQLDHTYMAGGNVKWYNRSEK